MSGKGKLTPNFILFSDVHRLCDCSKEFGSILFFEAFSSFKASGEDVKRI